MSNLRYCQSCGMPMGETNELYGTNSDGSTNEDYCKYCYVDGKFTTDCSMEEMIEFCVPHMVAAGGNMTEDNARGIMQELFPTLKRWKNI